MTSPGHKTDQQFRFAVVMLLWLYLLQMRQFCLFIYTYLTKNVLRQKMNEVHDNINEKKFVFKIFFKQFTGL